jgi:hypothetical protein
MGEFYRIAIDNRALTSQEVAQSAVFTRLSMNLAGVQCSKFCLGCAEVLTPLTQPGLCRGRGEGDRGGGLRSRCRPRDGRRQLAQQSSKQLERIAFARGRLRQAIAW